MSNQINTLPLSQFAQILRAAELAQQKEVKIPIQQARLLGLALVEIQEKIIQDYENLLVQLKSSGSNEVISVQLDGGKL